MQESIGSTTWHQNSCQLDINVDARRYCHKIEVVIYLLPPCQSMCLRQVAGRSSHMLVVKTFRESISYLMSA